MQVVRTFARLKASERATTTMEFALIAPALLMTLFGLFEYSHNIYTKTMLEGAIQKAARDSTIEGFAGRETTLNTNVTRAVKKIVPRATVAFSRKAYTNFSDVGRPEDYTDSNSDSVCNNNEPFEDMNGNGTWDTDRARSGNGSARDAVLYEVTVTYRSYFPIGEFIGLDPNNTTRARTVLRNQPFEAQANTMTLGHCV